MTLQVSFLAALLLCPVLESVAQSPNHVAARAPSSTASDKRSPVSNPLAIAPREWASRTAANEVLAIDHPNSYVRYRMHVIDHKGDRIRDVVESRDGGISRTILANGGPLAADEDKDERDRLTGLLESPSKYARHTKNEGSSRKLAVDLVQLMPDAMLYSYTAGQPQTARGAHGQQVVLDYHPNPDWHPPTTTSEALQGLEGRMWIEADSGQLLRMEGNIFRPVNLGWGMLARIYPGGKVVLEQTEIGSQRWIYSHFAQDVMVRALLVKSMDIHTTIETSGYQWIPRPLSYQEAIRLLLDTPLPQH